MKHVLVALGLVAGLVGVAAAADVQSPMSVKGATTVDTARAKALFEKGIPFIDVRTDADWEAGRIPGATHLELKKGFSDKALLDVVRKKDAEVLIYCNGLSCLRSAEACEKATGWGYTKLYYFRDGYPGWKAAGYAVE